MRLELWKQEQKNTSYTEVMVLYQKNPVPIFIYTEKSAVFFLAILAHYFLPGYLSKTALVPWQASVIKSVREVSICYIAIAAIIKKQERSEALTSSVDVMLPSNTSDENCRLSQLSEKDSARTEKLFV